MPGPKRLPKPLRQTLRARARQMRKELTPAELRLWAQLRGDQLGYRFRRQYPIGQYIIDFFCPAARLVVEVDGDTHSETQEYDELRTQFLASRGLQVIRFENSDVLTNIDSVVEMILEACQRNAPSPHPSP